MIYYYLNESIAQKQMSVQVDIRLKRANKVYREGVRVFCAYVE